MNWEFKQLSNPKIKNPILIEGLPGMGNVGKIAVDFMIDNLNAKKLFEISSYNFPHCVFVNEQNLIELPTIDVYYKNIKNKTLLLLSGDIQPLNEQACYEFCHGVLDTFEKKNVKEIITLGGIALPRIPISPKIYCTGNSKDIINKYKSPKINPNIHGVVGPIIGVSGLLAGLAGKRKIPAISLLAETFGHPNYLGMRGAREIIKVLNKKFNLKLNLEELNNEINEIEDGLKLRNQFKKTFSKPGLKKQLTKTENIAHSNYIG